MIDTIEKYIEEKYEIDSCYNYHEYGINNICRNIINEFNTKEIYVEMNTALYIHVLNFNINVNDDRIHYKIKLNDDVDLNKVNFFFYNPKIGKYTLTNELLISNIYEDIDRFEYEQSHNINDFTNIDKLMFVRQGTNLEMYKEFAKKENLDLSIMCDKTISHIDRHIKQCKSHLNPRGADDYYRIGMLVRFTFCDFVDREEEVLEYIKNHYFERNDKVLEIITKIKINKQDGKIIESWVYR